MKNESKKSFVLYADYSTFITELSNEQKGQVFQQIFDYINEGHELVTSDMVVKVVWLQIKNNLDRDLKKWETKVEKRELDGKLGGIVRALKSGQSITKENAQFLLENTTEEYRNTQGITQQMVSDLSIPKYT